MTGETRPGSAEWPTELKSAQNKIIGCPSLGTKLVSLSGRRSKIGASGSPERVRAWRERVCEHAARECEHAARECEHAERESASMQRESVRACSGVQSVTGSML